MIIEDGTGSGNKAKVDAENRLYTLAVTDSQAVNAAIDGRGYNLNSGALALTTAADHAILYVKNNDTQGRVYFVESLIVGLGAVTGGGSVAGQIEINAVKNVTTGTIVSDATAAATNSNTNFGSSATFTANVYSGGQGKTATNGTNHALIYAQAGSRSVAPLALAIPVGQSIAITVNPNIAAGSIDVYVALAGNLRDV